MMKRILLLAGLMILAAAPAASARALGVELPAPTLESADPAPGSQMHKPPAEVTLTFSEPLDPSSILEVRDECDERVDDGAVVVNLNEMRVGIQDTPSGPYTVAFTAVGVGGVTGETSDRYRFSVHGGEPCSDGDSMEGHDHGGGADDGSERHGGMGEGHDAENGHPGGDGHGGDAPHGDMNDDGHGNGHGNRHGNGHGNRHGNGRKPSQEKPEPGDLADPGLGPQAGGPGIVPTPSGTALLAALLGATTFGALGGLILRVIQTD